MTYSIIKKSQLEGANRIDAEYFQSEYLISEEKLLKFNCFALEKITSIITQGPNPIFSLSGKCCLNGRNVKNSRVDAEETNYISELEFQKYKKFKVAVDDILITLKGLGSIGKTGLVFNDLNCIFSRDVGLIRIKNNRLSKFIYAFLLSKYGVFQIERSITGGTGQRTLATSFIRKFLIPQFSKEVINDVSELITGSEQHYENSKYFYSQAESLLLVELGLSSFAKASEDEERFYIVNFSEIKSENRMDAEYFQPKYERLISKLKSPDFAKASSGKQNPKLLGDLATIKKGVEPGSETYQEEGKLFIRVSSVSKFGIDKVDQKYLSNDLYEKLKSNNQPKIGEVLLTKDATPGIAYVLKESLEGIVSGGILRLKLKENIEPEFLALCINSLIGQMQAERDAGGSIIVHWKPEEIKKVIIPILPRSTQEKIAELVRKSHEARKKSKELLEEAKRKVEEMIEKGGE